MYKQLPPDKPLSSLPWALSLEERQSMLVKGTFKIAYFYEHPNDSTFRYRAFNFCESIQLNSPRMEVSASFFHITDAESFNWLALTANMLVVCRSGFSEGLFRLITLFKDKNKIVTFDVDDLVIDPLYTLDLMLALGQDVSSEQALDYWYAYTSRMRQTALLCDSITTTNEYLASIASKSLGKSAEVISNSLNQGQLLVSQAIYRTKLNSHFERDNRFTIGYFSGSPSHKKDFQLISNALKVLLEQRENVDIIVAGYIDLDNQLSLHSDRIHYEPFRDYLSLQNLMATCELCIAPLVYGTFTNCKSELKFFESAAVGTICVATPSFNFKKAIHHGRTGYLCRSHEWTNTLLQITENSNHIPDIAKNAQKFATRRYSPESIFKQIISAYQLNSLFRS